MMRTGFHINGRDCLQILLCFLFLAAGCGEPDSPIEKIKGDLKNSPEFSIILDDMKIEGDFFDQYYHRYWIINQDGDRKTGWLRVPQHVYKENRPYLGMVIAGKIENTPAPIAAPPGYQYAGKRRYGFWRKTPEGGKFWKFYDRYALFRDTFESLDNIDAEEYQLYLEAVRQKTAFFGRNHQYGVNGARTKLYRPAYYERRQKMDALESASLGDLIKRRIGRAGSGPPDGSADTECGDILIADRVLKSLALTFVFFVIFLAGKLLNKAAYRQFNMTMSKIENNKAAVSLASAGRYAGLVICIGAALDRPNQGRAIEEFVDLAVYGMLGVILLNCSWFICRKLVLKYFKALAEPVRDQDLGTAFIIAGVNIASSLVIYGAVTAETGPVWTCIAFWAVGQALLIIAGIIYHLFTPYNVHDDIEQTHTEADMMFAGAYVSMGVIVGPAASRFYTAGMDNLLGFAFMAGAGLLILPAVRLLVQKIILPAVNLTDQMITQEKLNLSAAYIEISTFIAASALIYWCA